VKARAAATVRKSGVQTENNEADRFGNSGTNWLSEFTRFIKSIQKTV